MVSEDTPSGHWVDSHWSSWHVWFRQEGSRVTCCDYTDMASDQSHVWHAALLHVLCVVTLISHASILITIPDFKLARHKCQCFKFRGYFTNYCSNKLHSTNVKGSHSIIFQSGLQCYEWQLISQQTQEAIIDCGKNMFMSIIFYWQSFIFYKYHRK